MPPSIAIFGSLIFIATFWYRDHKKRPELSAALWIPVLWLLVLGSRPLSFWLGFGGGGERSEGNAFDRNFYLLQIAASFVIVSRRGIVWSDILRNNKLLFILYGYLLITIFWSPLPLPTFKRWFKDIGTLSVILIVITEKKPLEAIFALFLRCAYVLLPLSVVFIKYVPELGRAYARSGGAMFTGVTSQKNSLGEIVLIFGLVIFWNITRNAQSFRDLASKKLFDSYLILAIGFWLLHMSQSKTALICLIIGSFILLSHLLPILRVSPRRLVSFLLVAIPVIGLAEYFFDVSKLVLAAINRDPTLTGRKDIWRVLERYPVDPLIGIGYLVFWDVHPYIEFDTEWGGQMVNLLTAHNGYVEIHLDGGAVAFALLILLLLATLFRIVKGVMTGSGFSRMQLALFIVMIVYNFSESTFFRRSPIWFAYLLFCSSWPAYMYIRTSSVTNPCVSERKAAVY